MIPVLFLIISGTLVSSFLPNSKSKFNLLVVAVVISTLVWISFVIQYFVSDSWRQQVNKTLGLFKNQIG